MYVSTKLSFKLDEVIKSFEVALRSYLATKISPMFDSEDDFKTYLINLQGKHQPSSIVLSSRIDTILKYFIKDYKNIYLLFQTASDTTILQDYEDNEVPYVSQLINLIVLFFKDLDELKGMSNNYTTVEEFLYKCSLYHRVRNDLSHPGSKKVLKSDASEILKLIMKFINYLDDKYFWYITKNELEKKIDIYYREEKNKILKYDNLKNITVPHQKTLCRESELKILHECILGQTQYSRVAGSTVIYGYGGVGKTALVIDFIYEILQKMQEEEYKEQFDFIFFFSSKEEVLTTKKTTGEFYIDKIHVDIHSFNEILTQILALLSINNLSELQQTKLKGLIVIDNIENLGEEDKSKIFEFMKNIPRDIQFILTSRSEEKTEEKLHLSEFKDFIQGKKFIESYIDSNDLNLSFIDSDIDILLSATKGNTLLLVQSLRSLHDKTTTINEISNDLNNYESSSFEKVASFMYKNTFDNALKELESKKLDPKNIILVATLYKEKIDLYALSQLTDVSINNVREIANYLTSKLIFDKTHEFYTVNEFASRFIFISLMPNIREKDILLEKIAEYKKDLNSKLTKLEEQMKSNEKIHRIITDWKPNNYIDKIVIAQVFQMFNAFKKVIEKRDTAELNKLFDEYEKHEYITKHPYIRFQKARILNLMLSKNYFGTKTKEDRVLEIKRCYEDTLESINTSYSYIKNTESHISVLMFFGFFLNKNLNDLPKAIRYLEDAMELQQDKADRKYYLVPNELSYLYIKMYEEKNDEYYIKQYNIVYDRIVSSNVKSKYPNLFDVDVYIEKQKKFTNNIKKTITEWLHCQ
jgi:nucleoside-triphosphatase THEP1